MQARFDIESILTDDYRTLSPTDLKIFEDDKNTGSGYGNFSRVRLTVAAAAAAANAFSSAEKTDQQAQPTLAELQLLFGYGVHKHEYSRSRKAAANRKARQAYSNQQLDCLESEFQADKYLSVSKRHKLSERLSLTETQIKTCISMFYICGQFRFQNRRTKWKKEMTQSLRRLYRQSSIISIDKAQSED